MTYINGELSFKNKLSLDRAFKALEIVFINPDGLKVQGPMIKFWGEEYGDLEYVLLLLDGIVGGEIEASSEDDDSSWYYIFEKGKWYWGAYEKVRGKKQLCTMQQTQISKEDKEKIDEILGKQMDRVS